MIADLGWILLTVILTPITSVLCCVFGLALQDLLGLTNTD